MKNYTKNLTIPVVGPYTDPTNCDCGFDCGNKIADFQDDCGEFCVLTPNGYTGICKTCWDKGGYSTAER